MKTTRKSLLQIDFINTKDGSDQDETSMGRSDGVFLIIDNCDVFVKNHK